MFCLCGVLGHLAPVHRGACSVCCFACAVCWATWLLFTGVPAWCVALLVRCPGPLNSCSPVCPLGVLPLCTVSWATWLLLTGVPAWCVVLLVRCPRPLGSSSPVCALGALLCLSGVLGHLAPVHRCACSVCCLCLRCPGPLGSCSPVCPLGALFCLCGVLGHLAPVHRCASSVCCLCLRCPGPLGSCSPVCPLGALFCLCGVLGHLAPVHRCARSTCCVACAVSWATWLLFTGVPAWCVFLLVRCPGPLGSCSPMCPLGVLCCVCGVLGHLAPVHWCAHSACCVAWAVSWATWLLFTGVPNRCAVLCVWCPGPLSSCSLVCLLGALLCVCGVLGHLAPVHRCARSVCCCACAVPWATWLPFTGVPTQCVALRVRCPGPLGSCSPVCLRDLLCCVCSVLGHLAPVHRCARSACCFACAVSWATWLLFTGVPAPCVALRVRCPGPLGFCSPVCPLGVLCCMCCVLGHLAPVHRCVRVVCVACALSLATWLLFTGVPARCVILLVQCPGPLASCSPVCPLGALLCVCGVLGHLAPVHRCARSVCCFACAVSWATWLLFTGVPARCVALRVRCPGPLGSCAPVCPRRVLFCLCGVLGNLAPVHRCARSVCCVACPVCSAPSFLFMGCPLLVLCCVCGVLGLLAPVRRCACPVCCAVSWAPWLLFTGVLVRCVVLWVACAGRRCRALTCSSARWLFVAGRGWIPTGRALVRPDGGCSWPAGAGYPLGAHASIRTAAVP